MNFFLKVVKLATIYSLALVSAQGEQLNESNYEKYINLLQPKPDEVWRSIPWKISLLEAQAVAVTQRKPLFIWAMDGHPLACV